jgi:entericidin B
MNINWQLKDDIMIKKTIAAFFTLLVLSSVLSGCNTTKGMGEDISDGGSAISGAATKAQN